MSPSTEHAAYLVSSRLRLRWALLGREAMVALVPLGLVIDGADRAGTRTLMAVGLGWLLITVPTLLAPRIGPAVARFTGNATLLGDGLLLCTLWWVLGGLDGPGGHLVWLHCAAVTLLVSFRTGLKMAIWQGLLALVALEAAAAGVLGPATPFDMSDLVVYQVTVVSTVLAAGAFAAIKDRELRRRRFDSAVLRRLAVVLAPDRQAGEITAALGDFAVRQLLAPRAAVLAWQPTGDGTVTLTAAAGGGAPTGSAVPPDLPDTSIVAAAMRDGRTRCVTRLDPAGDPRLAELLPGARNLIVVPFVLDQVRGALVMAAPHSRSGRVESRVGDTAEQATALAANALGRAVLAESARSPADDRQYVA